MGLAIDPDADRLSLVDETGRPMGEDMTLALACAAVLARTPGPVVTNLSTSAVVGDVADAFHSPLVRAPVGEVNVARRMQAESAVVGERATEASSFRRCTTHVTRRWHRRS